MVKDGGAIENEIFRRWRRVENKVVFLLSILFNSFPIFMRQNNCLLNQIEWIMDDGSNGICDTGQPKIWRSTIQLGRE